MNINRAMEFGTNIEGNHQQEHWSGLPSHSPGDFPVPRIKPMSPALAGGFFITEPPGKPPVLDTRQNTYSLLSSASDS